MTLRIITAACLSVCAALHSANAQDTVYFPAADRIAIRHLKSVPPIDIAPGIHVHTVVGTTGSVSFAEFDSGSVSPPHHHTREQADVGLSGRTDMIIGTNVESLEPRSGVIVPSNVRHSIANPRGGTRTLLEFHTVRRPDIVPPRRAMTFPMAAEPVPPPSDRGLISVMDAGVGSTLSGETCTMRWRRLTSSVDVHPAATPTELFVYVASGTVRLGSSGLTTKLGTGTLIIIPATMRNVQLSASGAEGASVIEFSVRKSAT